MSKKMRRHFWERWPPTCPYCGSPARLTDSYEIYGRSYGGLKIWVCQNYPACDSYVGAHKADNLPKGTLANAALRQLRKQAHGCFDQLWQGGAMSRTDAYAWLSASLGIPADKTHIGMFNEGLCREAIAVIRTHFGMPPL